MSYLDSYYVACRFKNVRIRKCACGRDSLGQHCEICLKGKLMALGVNSKVLADLSDSLKSNSGELTKIKALVNADLFVKDSAHRSKILLNFLLSSHEDQAKSLENIKHTEELLNAIKGHSGH